MAINIVDKMPSQFSFSTHPCDFSVSKADLELPVTVIFTSRALSCTDEPLTNDLAEVWVFLCEVYW